MNTGETHHARQALLRRSELPGGINNFDQISFDKADHALTKPTFREFKSFSKASKNTLNIAGMYDFPSIKYLRKNITINSRLDLSTLPKDISESSFKRMFDVVFSAIALLLLAPLMATIYLLIKFDSPGPALFRQSRNGLNGKPIDILKFRTMNVLENGSTVAQAKRNDVRITAIGKLLRKTSLDELPQFFNVLQGSMSVVGPRPHAVAHNQYYGNEIPNYNYRELVKPGITGLAQINGARGPTETIEKMERRIMLDIKYIQNWSVWLDISIVYLTVKRGFCDKNAY